MTSRSPLHAMPEAAALLRSMRLRPADARALPAIARYGATLTGVGLAAARRSPDRAMLTDHLGPLTGTELEHAVDAMASALAREARRTGGRRVAVYAADHRGFVAGVIAAGALGLDAVLIGSSVGSERLGQILANESFTAVIADGGAHAALEAAGYRGVRIDALEVVASRAWAPSVLAGPRPRRVGSLTVLSSGTTGVPRPTARAGVRASQLPTVLSLLAALGLRRGEPVLITPPLAHGHGLSVLAAALITGSPIVLAQGHSPHCILALLRQHRAGALLTVPAHLSRVLDALDAGHEPPPALRRIACGSAPLAPEVAARVQARFGDVLVDYFGSSEAGTATIATAADLREAPGTVGRPATGVRIEILTESGERLKPGEHGQVAIRSAWRSSDTPRGAHRTGDLGRIDAHGRLFLLGRSDDLAIVGGHNVHLGAVREWLTQQPEVSSAVVHRLQHPELGEVLTAEVTGERVDADALHVRARAALGHAAPRSIRLAPPSG